MSFPSSQELDEPTSSRLHINKSCASALLTLVVPEESPSREEEIKLLKNPQALWTVLIVNGIRPFAFDHTSAQYSTPLSQFIRGITSSVCTQRKNAQSIYDAISNTLKSHDDDSLFDDEGYTKSATFHFAVRACNELEASVDSSLKFIRRVVNGPIRLFCDDAHVYEKLGIDFWSRKLDEDIFALTDLQAQIKTLRSQVQESVRTPSVSMLDHIRVY
jgi:hypothetical protein